MLCDAWCAIIVRRSDVTENMLQQIIYLLQQIKKLLQQIIYLLQQIFYLLQQIFYLLQQIFHTSEIFVRATLSTKLSKLKYVEVCT